MNEKQKWSLFMMSVSLLITVIIGMIFTVKLIALERLYARESQEYKQGLLYLDKRITELEKK